MLATPSEAAAVLGISRQGLLKRRRDLERHGQATSSSGRLQIELSGLMAWWCENSRGGETVARLTGLRRLLADAPEPEALLLANGGTVFVCTVVGVLAELRPGGTIETTTLEVDGVPLPEVWQQLAAELRQGVEP
jgi:hypothetical protein